MKNYLDKFTHFSVMSRATMVRGAEAFLEIVHAVEIFEK